MLKVLSGFVAALDDWLWGLPFIIILLGTHIFCMLFQGQEFLQGEWFRDDVPLDWDLKEDFHGLVRLYRDLARLRLNRGGVTRGLCGQHVRVFHLNEDEKISAEIGRASCRERV